MCGASYCVVDPAVGDLRSSSISENAVLHALDTWIFPQVPKGWFVFFHLCTHKQKISTKKIGLWPYRTGDLWLFCAINSETDSHLLKDTAQTHTQTTLKGVAVCSKKTCRLQTLNSTEATQTTKESFAADSGAKGKICWGETLIIIIITFLLSASRSLKDLTNAALALCSLTQPNPGLLVKGNLPVEFTQGKISKH